MSDSPLLALNLTVSYPAKRAVLRDVRLEVNPGEIVGLVGKSGCGKSTLALAILKLLHLRNAEAQGAMRFGGRDLMILKEREMRALRGREIGLVLQSPMSALNPALRIGTQLAEAWQIHRPGGRQERQQALREILDDVSLPSDPDFLRRFPSQLSVGQAQRVLIAMAVMHHPPLLIADEPTSALDVITQAEILRLFASLSRKFGMSILYISHDLLSVATISRRIAVMHEGAIVECRPTSEIFDDPRHPFTRDLIRALPLRERGASASAATT
jgi:ABC-type dipeptide/oligopeptide/nickel transport system ATPase component